ncbi:TRAP transporter permease [Limimaricola pyoseonensis]|uniref:TRAP transporter, 4TM/12TM fusion protein n=1 Tax=Limimaricola pyoseonensis TaxID=521013 RepID=A0A1G7HT22_9RHOB|nr:TRAP transporter fused permease subunit [Limimaricola pyoseonensis]SDF03637.1 TRAP transporter, 4TM/12TM fusion protein [Limimaricola pyoseonensis]
MSDSHARPTWPQLGRDAAALGFAALTLVMASGLFFVDPVINRILHIGVGFVMLFAMRAVPRSGWRWPAVIALVTMVGVTAYALHLYPIAWQFVGLPPSRLEIGLGVAAILISLLAAWMVAGPSIPIIASFFVVYTLAGNSLPAPFSHAGLDIEQIVQALYVTGRGIYGTIAGVSANYIVLFVIFAAYLGQIGLIDFLLYKSRAVLGRTRGGPAKIAVVASGSLGAVMGTAYGNTASTGAFTIPMMRRSGFNPAFAAAVEATASVGGQFVPPILGGAAFLMVDILGITYNSVMLASLPLAILFYGSIFLMVDLTAVRQGIRSVPAQVRDEAPQDLLWGGWLKLLPIAVLIAMLVQGFTPQRAGFWAILSVMAVDLIETRSLGGVLRNLLRGLIEGAKGSAVIVGIVAAAGIIAGLTSTTGLGLVLSQILSQLAGNSYFLLLLLSAVTSIILGLGLPTIVCYLLMAVLVAPALIDAGVAPIAAHLFLIYFASLSSITPPVGPSNFIAATIAGEGTKPMAVGLFAMQLALPGFIIPMIFAYHPELLLQDGLTWQVLWSLLTAFLGIYALTAAQTGALLPGWVMSGAAPRVAVLAAAGLLLWPHAASDLAGIAVLVLAHVLVAARRHPVAEAAR